MKIAASILTLVLTICSFNSEAGRIRNRKVKEAPKSCKLMTEDSYLSRTDKKVMGTLRHSLVIEDSSEQKAVYLIKDKGEKICQWDIQDWQKVESLQNRDLSSLRFHIDEYKEVLYPYFQNDDKSFLLMSIPFKTCALEDQHVQAKLDLPKCSRDSKKSKRKHAKSRKTASAGNS